MLPKLADKLQQKCGAELLVNPWGWTSVGRRHCRLIHDPLPHWEAMVKSYGNMLTELWETIGIPRGNGEKAMKKH